MSEFTYQTMPVSSEPVDAPEPKTMTINFGEHMFIFPEGDLLSGLVVKLDTMTLLEGGIGDFLQRSGQSLDFDLLGTSLRGEVAGTALTSGGNESLQEPTTFSSLDQGAFESGDLVLDDLLVRFELMPFGFIADIP